MEREFSSLLISRRPSYPFEYRASSREWQNWKGPTDFETEEAYKVIPFKSLPELRWQQQLQNFKENVQSDGVSRTNDVPPKVDVVDQHIVFSKSSSTPMLKDLSRCERKPSLGKNTESAQSSSVNYRFFEVKYFPHFEYIYTQTRDCKKRVERAQKKVEALGKELPRDVIIKIGIVGDFTKDDLHLISKSTGKRTISKDQHIWEAQPLICFQNDLSSESKLKKDNLRQEKACHKVLIKPNTFCDDTDETVYSIISVVRNRAQIQEAISSCLEEPIHQLLDKLWKDLNTAGLNTIPSGITAEIEAIRKQMTLENSSDISAAPVLQNVGTESVIPENIKDYLFGRPDVHSFGIWRNSSFKVLVKKTDENMLRSELTKKNPTFFETYNLEVEKRKLDNKQTLMMQGDSILAKIRNKDGNFCKGTLGGFVIKSDEEQKKYALTCNHIFPEVDEPAYNQDLENIGSCLFTTREQSCDFAAIEIEQSFADKCDVYVKREDRKKTNARVYSGNIGNIGLVHKIGATTDVTKGSILSPEWHERVLGRNWVSTFLVQGIGENFSEEGDSGSLVFSRQRSVQQNCVDVMGMVYGNKLTVYDTDEENEHVENNSNEGEIAASNVQDADNISGCFRIHTALELFKDSQGEDFEVKFKDDLSSSSPSSSLSDDSNEEPI